MTTKTTSTEHLAPLITPITVVDIDDLEVCNTEIGDQWETFEISGFAANISLRFRTIDTAALVAKLQSLLDDAAGAADDERDRLAPRCICGERIAPDDDDCGRERCAAELVGAGF